MKGEKRVSLSFSLALSHALARLGVSLREPCSSTLPARVPRGRGPPLCVPVADNLHVYLMLTCCQC